VTRYEDIAAILKDPGRFSSIQATGPVLSRQINEGVAELVASGDAGIEATLQRVNRGRTQVLLSADPPLHARQRKLVNRAFTQRRVKEADTSIRDIAEKLVDGFSGAGRVELVSAFAVPLPLSVIADRLGVSREGMADFKRWSDDFTAAIGNHHMSPAELRSMLVSQAEFFTYFEARVDERKQEPGDDLLSEIANATLPDGDRLTTPEILGMLNQILVAGNETTTKLLAFAMRTLASDPELAGRLRADPALVEPFVEEMLRLEAPVQGLYRQAVESCEVAGVAIPAGASLWLAYSSANHDPSVFAKPEELDLARTFSRPHLAFGFGEHFCLGAALARAEARIGITVLLERLRDLALDGNNRFEYEHSYALHGLRELWLTFAPALA
jgi:cytochrome P450